MSTIVVREFRPSDPSNLIAQEAQVSEAHSVSSWTRRDWEAQRDLSIESWTAVRDETTVAFGFIWPRWAGRAESGMIISASVVGVMMLPIHRHVMSVLESSYSKHSLHRIETVVRVGFDAGVRWAEMLGFSLEGRMSRYGPDRSDYLLYARLAKD